MEFVRLLLDISAGELLALVALVLVVTLAVVMVLRP